MSLHRRDPAHHRGCQRVDHRRVAPADLAQHDRRSDLPLVRGALEQRQNPSELRIGHDPMVAVAPALWQKAEGGLAACAAAPHGRPEGEGQQRQTHESFAAAGPR